MNLLRIVQKIATRLGYDEASDTINFNADNLAVRDPAILLNAKENGSGVTGNEAGIFIDRGSSPQAVFIFDESSGGFLVGTVGDTFLLKPYDNQISTNVNNIRQHVDTLAWMRI